MKFKEFVQELNKDLGCIELVFLEQKELSETKWENGILLMYDSTWDDCWTPFGVVPGRVRNKFYCLIRFLTLTLSGFQTLHNSIAITQNSLVS